MDPPLISEASFSAANPSSYTLAEIWPFSINGNEPAGAGGNNLGLRMANFTAFGELNREMSSLQEESTVTSGSRCNGARKRRDVNSEDESSMIVSTSCGNDLSNLSGKRVKLLGSKDEVGNSKVEMDTSCGSGSKPAEQNSKPSEPLKDYIHVRARRGQATDSHSLAERARREKISERMKILQDLVPGCNKVIGKALVLDEIINYIQSLQHQVEFLSMKLETVNTRMNPAAEGFPSKDLGPPSFDPAGMIYGAQAAAVRDYGQGSQPEWLHMQLGSSFERAT